LTTRIMVYKMVFQTANEGKVCYYPEKLPLDFSILSILIVNRVTQTR
jgi:hypothetical protein